jgi:hypothetical protein
MSKPSEPEDVKLVCSLFSSSEDLIDTVIAEMEETLGPTDWKSPRLHFDRTTYYAEEMGWPLHRLFLSFRDLIRPDDLVDIKLKTNDLEQAHLKNGNRTINIDPGYVCLERLVLATGKNYTHRIHLSKGIYADLTLVFQRGCFTFLDWTYRDYADPEIIAFFNAIRETYKKQIRGIL